MRWLLLGASSLSPLLEADARGEVFVRLGPFFLFWLSILAFVTKKSSTTCNSFDTSASNTFYSMEKDCLTLGWKLPSTFEYISLLQLILSHHISFHFSSSSHQKKPKITKVMGKAKVRRSISLSNNDELKLI